MLTRAFDIVADDSSMGGVPAMSRPPSRVDTNLLDLSAEHAAGRHLPKSYGFAYAHNSAASASNVKTLKEQEEMNDPALQRAMAESLRQTLPAQENGVTGTGSHFGPANREYYDPSRWTVTTFSTSREIIDHPPPTKRRRLEDQPAFLRGSKETGYLGPLLTIYHSIPLAREALLMPTLRVHAYAHDGSWWSGTTDENTKALSTDNTLRIDRDECNLLAEVQCLMAFLDRTTRAYGSVDALADLPAVRSQSGNSPLARFLTSWNSASMRQAPQEQLTQVFSSTAVKGGGLGESAEAEKSLLFVEPYINRIPDETLVDLLDSTIWNDDIGNIDDVWISHPAEIFTIRVFDPNSNGGKTGLDLKLDPVWYADRYMYECRDAMQQIRKQLQLIRREIDHCTTLQRRVEVLKLADNRILSIRDVLDAAAKASAVLVGKKPASNGFLEDRLSDNGVTQSDVEAVGLELQNVIGRIEQKLHQLEQRKNELRLRSRQIAMQLTHPTPENPDIPHRRYTLQGVSTKPEITYVRRPNKDLIVLDSQDELSVREEGYQWWKMSWLQEDAQKALPQAPMMGPITQAQAEADQKLGDVFGTDASKPYMVVKVSGNEVLEAVKEGHDSVLLVYANDHAMKFQGGDLSLPLRHFMDRDNQAFAEEVQHEEGVMQTTSGDGDAEIEFEDVPLIDPTGSSSSAREITPMSTSSPGRDEDGQPSPKRAKEDNSSGVLELPPSYEESMGKQEMQEMQEKKGNKIGLYAEQMLQRYGSDAGKGTGEKENGGNFMHIEHSG